MAYHTVLYLAVFLPAALFCYRVVPQKYRWSVLLGFSYWFFWMISRKLVLFLMGTTVLVHYLGLWMENIRFRDTEKGGVRNQERWVLGAGILALLGILAYLKYYNFFAQNINRILELAGGLPKFPPKELLMPVGISFYTLQAVGYLADVYWKRIPAEHHLGKLALFLGFFPQLMEGPICRYSDTADQIFQCAPLQRENLTAGGIRILWGLFKKMVIADRMYVVASELFDNYENYSGILILAAAVAYTVQLYMEFSGCMDIVAGSARMFGVILPENFRQPFASRTTAEFWRRWHITLGVWLRTYIFYPISISGFAKKWNRFARKHLGTFGAKLGTAAIALFPVWLFNGIWHGARWSYFFYGMYYFMLIFLGMAVEPLRSRIINLFHVQENSWFWRGLQSAKMMAIILIGELFFRAEGLGTGLQMFFSMFRGFRLKELWDGTLLTLGLNLEDYIVVLAGCAIVAAAGHLKEKGRLSLEGLMKLRLPVRWTIYYSLILMVIIFGAYGEGYQVVDLIYAGF